MGPDSEAVRQAGQIVEQTHDVSHLQARLIIESEIALSPRERALCTMAEKLTGSPARMVEEDWQPLPRCPRSSSPPAPRGLHPLPALLLLES